MKKFFYIAQIMYALAAIFTFSEVIFRGLDLEALYIRFFIFLFVYVFVYAIPIGIWIYRDSRKTFGSTRDEAVDDSGFFPLFVPVGAFPVVREYFKKREQFLTDEAFRGAFLQKREELRKPLTGEGRKKTIYAIIILIVIVYGLFLVTYYLPNSPLTRIIPEFFED